MLTKETRKELLAFLETKHENPTIVLLPDFFQDRLITLDANVASTFSQIDAVAKHKGGSMDGISQTDVTGGNAINTASALAALGAKVIPIVCADELGIHQIKQRLKKTWADLTHIKKVAHASKTTALEFETLKGRTNVMLRDLGSLIDFGPEKLTEKDYISIEEADYVCVFNWAGTKKFGTQLASTVFKRVKTKGKGKTYFDTADPGPNSGAISALIREVLKSSDVDILSVNENEAMTYARLLCPVTSGKETETRLEEIALESARFLAGNLTARIDLHTTIFSATVTKNEETIIPTFRIKALRATGAGDAWNAGNILGDALNLSDEARLALGNAVSAYYLSSPAGIHPNVKKLARFIDENG